MEREWLDISFKAGLSLIFKFTYKNFYDNFIENYLKNIHHGAVAKILVR